MPYFVVVRSQVKPFTIKSGDSHRIDTDVLPEEYDTLAAAEQAARQRAELVQAWPWSSVYVVEGPNRARAAHLDDPNAEEVAHAHNLIVRAALRDPERRVPEPAHRLSVFRPPRVPPGPPPSSALLPAAFTAPAVQVALESLTAAGFALIPRGSSAYFEGRPRYFPTDMAGAHGIAAVQGEIRKRGQGAELTIEQTWQLARRRQELTYRSVEDVRGVGQEFMLYEGDGEYDIGDLNIVEFRSGEDPIRVIQQTWETMERRRQAMGLKLPRDAGRENLKRTRQFLQGPVLLLLRLWGPDDEELATAVAPLQRVLGPPISLDG